MPSEESEQNSHTGPSCAARCVAGARLAPDVPSCPDRAVAGRCYSADGEPVKGKAAFAVRRSGARPRGGREPSRQGAHHAEGRNAEQVAAMTTGQKMKQLLPRTVIASSARASVRCAAEEAARNRGTPVAERDWEPPQPRFAHVQIVGLHVPLADVAVRERVKEAGWTRNAQRTVCGNHAMIAPSRSPWSTGSVRTRGPSAARASDGRGRDGAAPTCTPRCRRASRCRGQHPLVDSTGG